MPSYSQIIHEACQAAGNVLMAGRGVAKVSHKSVRDLVTEADFEAQKAAWRIIREAFPEHRLLAEETITDPGFDLGPADSNYRWILDPLDGTINYAHGSPHFCVSLALECGGELMVCGIYAPCYDEFYTAVAGRGARLNGKEIQCSKTNLMVEALGAFGFPVQPDESTPDYQTFLTAVQEFQALRRTGSIALNLAYIAAGRFDAGWSFSAKPWDVAAGALLIQEAGGVVTGPTGLPFDVDRAALIAAGTPELHQQMLNLFPKEK